MSAPYPLGAGAIRTLEKCSICNERVSAFAAREGATVVFSAHYDARQLSRCPGSQRRVAISKVSKEPKE